ncbi:hypothetical protein BZA77DRAFT_347270 [Pyronema omphalodes]|nr:hypothetical protein BZA77DRAFT_347270 [Pyronema omphalodes]
MLAQDIRRKFLLIVCACVVSLAQNKGPPDKINNFCSIRGSSLYNYNKKVYIYGGFASWTQGFDNYTGPKISDDDLRTIDVSRPFDIALDVYTYVKQTPLPNTVPRDTTSALWPIAKDTLASFFGWHEVSQYAVDNKASAITKAYPLNSKFTHDTSTNTWTAGHVKSTTNFQLPNNQNDAFLKIGTSMSAWVPSLRRGYYFGGYVNKAGANLTWNIDRSVSYHNGMLIYNADSDALTNVTIPLEIVYGQLVHLSTKDDEILINFGGRTPGPRAMTDFLIYSTKQSKWFSFSSSQSQNIPEARAWFCATVVSAPDNSSHQIFIYGGGTNESHAASEETVWVLSIPSFDWVKLLGNAVDSSVLLPRGRREPTCVRVGKKYMMSWGGSPGQGCDDQAHNVFLLDMTRGSWVNKFNPDDDYEVPQSVVDVIGGTRKGGAQKLKPDGGFRDTELEKLMTFNIGSGNGQTSDASGKHAAANKSNTGAIVGGVVGGIAGLAIIGGAVFYFLRKQRYAALAENGQSQIERSPGPVEAPAEASNKSSVPPNEGIYQTEYYPVSHPVELYPGDVRLSELEGVRSQNELPADHPIRR